MNRFISGMFFLTLACGSANASRVFNLGYLSADNPYTDAYGVSADGRVVVGYSRSTPGYQAFRWENGVMTGLGELPGGSFWSGAYGVSADGSVVVGSSNSALGTEAFRWENGIMTGLSDLPGGDFASNGRDVSADGSVVVGSSSSALGTEAFRWENGVMTGLGDLPGGSFYSAAFAVSADGSVVVGISSSDTGLEVFRWENGSMTSLGPTLGPQPSYASYVDVSADSSTVVGQGILSIEFQNVIYNYPLAARWRDGFRIILGDLPGGRYESEAHGVSADGSTVVGLAWNNGTPYVGPRQAFIWTEADGMQRLMDVLLGLGTSGLPVGEFEDATDISDDGRVIVVNGGLSAYMVRLDSPHALTANIDIQPFDTANEVKPASDDPIIVAVHSTSVAAGDATDFDATQVDPSSLKFGSGEAPNVAVTPWVQDLDGDADSDVMFAFRTQDTGIFCGDAEATLTGETYTAAPFTGTDTVTTTDCVATGCHP